MTYAFLLDHIHMDCSVIYNISPPGKWKLFIRRRSCSIFSDHEAILSISHVDQLIVRSERVHYDFGGLRLICRLHAVKHPRASCSDCSPSSSCWCERWLVPRFCWSARWLVEAQWRALEGLWRGLLICVSPPEGECRSKQRPLKMLLGQNTEYSALNHRSC